MDPRLQAKLLRAIQEREIDRVGGSKPVSIDVRILATSNRNLQQAVKNGDFREDLYFRLNVVNLRLPALRERREDIPVLAQHFATKYAKSNGVPEKPLSADALKRMQGYDWPGNVRELENTMHRAVLLAGPDEIGGDAILLTEGDALNDSPAPLGGADADSAAETATAETAGLGNGHAAPAADQDEERARLVGKTVAEVERDLIIDTLDHCLGNRTHAANILGISIRTLRNKLKQYSDDGFAVPMPGESEHRGA